MKSGIYQIKNLITNKLYIGSAVNFKNRWSKHKSELNKNIHGNKHLQASWNKYGEEAFEFKILEYSETNKLIEREQIYIDWFKPQYNKCPIAGSPLGRKYSKETLDRMSKGQKERYKDEKQKIARSLTLIGNSNRKGKKASEQTKINISKGKLGVSRSDNARLAISLGNKGKKKTKEHIAKIRESRFRNKKLKESLYDANV